MKLYLLPDLNDPSKMKLERRSQAPKNGYPAPEGEDAEWLKVVDITDEMGNEYKEVQVDEDKKLQVTLTRDSQAVDSAWQTLRHKRDKIINETVWRFERHQQELALGNITTLTTYEYNQWLVYWQALRDLPDSTVDPSNPVWPEQPE